MTNRSRIAANLRKNWGRLPFNERGKLDKAHYFFGEQRPKLRNELNEVLAA